MTTTIISSIRVKPDWRFLIFIEFKATSYLELNEEGLDFNLNCKVYAKKLVEISNRLIILELEIFLNSKGGLRGVNKVCILKR